MEKEKNRKGFVYKIKMHLTKEPEVQSYRLLSLLSLPIDICLQRILHLPKICRPPTQGSWLAQPQSLAGPRPSQNFSHWYY